MLSINVLFVYMQGEKGEPGLSLAADGVMMAGLTGPRGPPGVKVLLADHILPSDSG